MINFALNFQRPTLYCTPVVELIFTTTRFVRNSANAISLRCWVRFWLTVWETHQRIFFVRLIQMMSFKHNLVFRGFRPTLENVFKWMYHFLWMKFWWNRGAIWKNNGFFEQIDTLGPLMSYWDQVSFPPSRRTMPLCRHRLRFNFGPIK